MKGKTENQAGTRDGGSIGYGLEYTVTFSLIFRRAECFLLGNTCEKISGIIIFAVANQRLKPEGVALGLGR